MFHLRSRAKSLDSSKQEENKLSRLGKFFRNRWSVNESAPKPVASSPRAKPQPNRRFSRVVRDSGNPQEIDNNPHVVHKYSQIYLRNYYLQHSCSWDESVKYCNNDTTRTILKRSSVNSEDSKPRCKHASFSEEVDLLEYDDGADNTAPLNIQRLPLGEHVSNIENESTTEEIFKFEDIPESDDVIERQRIMARDKENIFNLDGDQNIKNADTAKLVNNEVSNECADQDDSNFKQLCVNCDSKRETSLLKHYRPIVNTLNPIIRAEA